MFVILWFLLLIGGFALAYWNDSIELFAIFFFSTLISIMVVLFVWVDSSGKCNSMLAWRNQIQEYTITLDKYNKTLEYLPKVDSTKVTNESNVTAWAVKETIRLQDNIKKCKELIAETKQSLKDRKDGIFYFTVNNECLTKY